MTSFMVVLKSSVCLTPLGWPCACAEVQSEPGASSAQVASDAIAAVAAWSCDFVHGSSYFSAVMTHACGISIFAPR
jgi:hypothetical protein